MSPHPRSVRLCLWVSAAALCSPAARALQDAAAPAPDDEGRFASIEERLAELEAENAALKAEQGAITDAFEGFSLGGLVPPLGESRYGLGPAASKIYGVSEGLAIGGYGEMLFSAVAGDSMSDRIDLLRTVLYVGYKFNERWVLNTELEFEHASTDESGSVSVEFATLDYLHAEALNARAGLLLLPMGMVNERHEPNTFFGAKRSEIERRIIPTTWRENGAGVFGDVGPLSYRAYAVNGFDGTGFAASGLRGGRQKGSNALAEDFAFVGRVDWTETPGLLAGVSGYLGDSGQGQSGLEDTTTAIVDLHAEWTWGGLALRGLWTQATVDDVTELNNALGLTGSESVGEELGGWYLDGGFDVLSLCENPHGMQLSPFVSYETLDTQQDVPSGFSADPDNDFDIVTFGLDFKPIANVVLKVDYEDLRGTDTPDGWNVLVGYSF